MIKDGREDLLKRGKENDLFILRCPNRCLSSTRQFGKLGWLLKVSNKKTKQIIHLFQIYFQLYTFSSSKNKQTKSSNFHRYQNNLFYRPKTVFWIYTRYYWFFFYRSFEANLGKIRDCKPSKSCKTFHYSAKVNNTLNYSQPF